MADIFISYSSADRDKAKKLADAIQQQGWSVWWDRKIPFGKSFDQVIEQELEAARCVVVVWTKTSVVSDWVKTEAAEGARRHILLPIFIDDVKIPLEFRRLQAANLTNWQPNSPDTEFDRLLTYLGEMLGAPPTARPEGVYTEGSRAMGNSAISQEQSEKTAREQSNRTPNAAPIDQPHAPAEPEPEFKPSAPESSQRREDHSAVQPVRGSGLPISRNTLLTLGGGAALLILIVVIAFRPFRSTVGERPPEQSASASISENQSAPEAASASPSTGTATHPLAQAPELMVPKLDQAKLALEPVTAGKDADAFYAKGEQYYYGKGVQQNYAEAAKWYLKAADRDHVGAQQKLAQMYKDGVGVSKSEEESLKWEMKALSRQQVESSKALDEMNKKALDAIRNIKGG